MKLKPASVGLLESPAWPGVLLPPVYAKPNVRPIPMVGVDCGGQPRCMLRSGPRVRHASVQARLLLLPELRPSVKLDRALPATSIVPGRPATSRDFQKSEKSRNCYCNAFANLLDSHCQLETKLMTAIRTPRIFGLSLLQESVGVFSWNAVDPGNRAAAVYLSTKPKEAAR